MTSNPYEQLYKSSVQKVSSFMTMNEAQQMARQMSMIYNAFGSALKDLVALLSVLYSNKSQNSSQKSTMQEVKQVPQQIQAQKSQSSRWSKLAKKGSKKNVPAQNLPEDNEVDFDKYKMIIPQNENTGFNKIKDIQKHSKNSHQFQIKNQSKPIERIQTVRGKKQRQNLNGYSCSMCDKFYKLFDKDFVDSKGNNRICNDCSRHRSNFPPTNFFSDFSQQFGLDD